MATENVMSSEDFQQCAAFHGHICPGLATGFRAAKAGLNRLEENRAEDEEIISIVETDACGVDAIQVLTGCTFGKGNLIYKDYGKTVFTFLERGSGRGVRVALKPDAFEPDARHRELIAKMREESATEAERSEFQKIHLQRARNVLEMPLEALFNIEEVKIQLPPKAKIEPSILCERCGEPTMSTKMVETGGKKICRGCADAA